MHDLLRQIRAAADDMVHDMIKHDRSAATTGLDFDRTVAELLVGWLACEVVTITDSVAEAVYDAVDDQLKDVVLMDDISELFSDYVDRRVEARAEAVANGDDPEEAVRDVEEVSLADILERKTSDLDEITKERVTEAAKDNAIKAWERDLNEMTKGI